MAATNDYVMPRIDGMPYLDKPIVYFAAEAAAMEILGPTELAARLPSYLFTLLTGLIIFLFARRVWGEDEAVIASIAYLSMPLTLAFARTVIFDSALSFFMIGALIAFYFAVECHANAVILRRADAEGTVSQARDGSFAALRRLRMTAAKRWSTIAWASIALGVLTKGPVAIAVPLLVAIVYAIRRKAFRALWSWWGLVAFIAIIAPWVWAVSQVVPDFLHYVLVTETARRLATKALKRTGPPWYFIPYLIGGALPWSIATAMSWRRKERDEPMIFAAIWILVTFVFFSISQSKRPQYILPVMPAIALMAARMWMRSDRWIVAARIAASIFIVVGVVLIALPFVHVKMQPEIAEGAHSSALPMGIASLMAGFAFIKRREIALIALTIPIITIPLTANPLMNAIGARRSAKSFVAQLPHDVRVVGVENFTGSMAFYLRRDFDVVTPDAEEFTSNYIIRHYDQFANDPKSPVKRTLMLERGVIYIVRNNDAAHRAMLEQSGFKIIASSPHHIAYR